MAVQEIQRDTFSFLGDRESWKKITRLIVEYSCDFQNYMYLYQFPSEDPGRHSRRSVMLPGYNMFIDGLVGAGPLELKGLRIGFSSNVRVVEIRVEFEPLASEFPPQSVVDKVLQVTNPEALQGSKDQGLFNTGYWSENIAEQTGITQKLLAPPAQAARTVTQAEMLGMMMKNAAAEAAFGLTSPAEERQEQGLQDIKPDGWMKDLKFDDGRTKYLKDVVLDVDTGTGRGSVTVGKAGEEGKPEIVLRPGDQIKMDVSSSDKTMWGERLTPEDFGSQGIKVYPDPAAPEGSVTVVSSVPRVFFSMSADWDPDSLPWDATAKVDPEPKPKPAVKSLTSKRRMSDEEV